MRGFYRNHWHKPLPKPELIDQKWWHFRWIQVHLLAGLDFIKSYGRDVKPNEKRLTNEVLDLKYLVNALLVGGVASRDSTIVDLFKFLRPDGIVLR